MLESQACARLSSLLPREARIATRCSVQTWTPGTWEVEVCGYRVQDQAGLLSEPLAQ